MLWDKPGGSWLWLPEPDGAGCTRLITRLRSCYACACQAYHRERADPRMAVAPMGGSDGDKRCQLISAP